MNTKDFYALGLANTRLKVWRPTGRLITTLFEHKNAVNTLAVTDDSQLFFTGSKLDQQVKVWLTRDIEGDVSSTSLMSVQTKR